MKQVCPICKKEFNVTNLFRGLWVCIWCYKGLVKSRDAKYYKELAEGDIHA